MNEWLMVSASALWLGILTSVSPCPLATNIAAISYIGKRVDRSGAAVFTGILYAAGRTLAYALLGLMLVHSLFSVPALSMWLQEYMNRFVGPVLIIAGLIVLGILSISLDFLSFGDRFSRWLQQQADRGGIFGALILGFFFALSFCPVSAALFFGSLIPLSLKHQSGIMLPLIYGIGTALPVLGVGMLLAAGGNSLGRTLNRVTQFEVWARRFTGVLFIGIGLYFTVAYTFELWM
ncbi:cytochrome C biogenesis protein [Desulfonema ishimotonii]|uniref:Cytochrome C biogenesis protein n=1 Tax=Desulfonema ishimotonii TaxID=45657 RepID=A0A401FST8_9BACT|nr:aromatic aminobenezylarsenical efflux permease ArsG family transporter [Desulfonema ishimotonii]GBC60010.1 cytochrome C biogenesis protein [Desulfonema ishimotonii]